MLTFDPSTSIHLLSLWQNNNSLKTNSSTKKQALQVEENSNINFGEITWQGGVFFCSPCCLRLCLESALVWCSSYSPPRLHL